jgi:hypothetical protein
VQHAKALKRWLDMAGAPIESRLTLSRRMLSIKRQFVMDDCGMHISRHM